MKRMTMTALMLFVALSFGVAVSLGQKPMGNKAGLEKRVNTFFDAVKAGNTDKRRPITLRTIPSPAQTAS